MTKEIKVSSFQEMVGREPARRVVINHQPELKLAQRLARRVFPFYFSDPKSVRPAVFDEDIRGLGRTFIVPSAQDPSDLRPFAQAANEIIARRAELALQQDETPNP
jgi:hypothetical protein